MCRRCPLERKVHKNQRQKRVMSVEDNQLQRGVGGALNIIHCFYRLEIGIGILHVSKKMLLKKVDKNQLQMGDTGRYR